MKVVTLVSVLVLGMSVVPGALGQASDAPEQPVPTIAVSGHGEFEVKPDRAVVRLGVVAQSESAADAQRLVNEPVTAIVKALVDLRISRKLIQTTSLQLNPVYADPRGPNRGQFHERRIVGYSATHVIQVAVEDLDQVGRVIDVALGAGANRVESLQFDLNNDRPYRKEALANAVRDAREKAETVADALGVQLGEVLELQESGIHLMRPQPRYGEVMLSAAADMSTPIEAGQIRVQATVAARYRIVEK